MTIPLFLLLLALILFTLSAFGVSSRINLQSAGLAAATLAVIVRMGL